MIVQRLFLYGVKFEYFQFRALILLLLVPSAIKFYQDLRLKNYDFLLSFSIIFIVLTLHIFLNLYYEKVGLTNHTLFSIIFFLLIFTISFYHLDFINKNIDLLIKIFIVIFFISCLFNFYQYKPDVPYFCGGISDFFLTNSILENSNIGASKVYPVTYYDRIGEVRLSFREFIFLENSHLGMIAPSVIIYSIHRVASKEISVLGIFLLSIFATLSGTSSFNRLKANTSRTFDNGMPVGARSCSKIASMLSIDNGADESDIFPLIVDIRLRIFSEVLCSMVSIR